MGIAWLVIVAAEMLVGGTGIGYFVWNEWNNLSLPNVIFAILMIGVVGMLLDLMFAPAAEGGDLCRLTAASDSFLQRRRPGRRPTQSASADAGHRLRQRQLRHRSAASSSASSATRGCGKTTILNVLAGLERPATATCFMDGREVAGPSLERGVVFQGHALMPWLTVRREHRLRGAQQVARLVGGAGATRRSRSTWTWSASTGADRQEAVAAVGRHEAARRHRAGLRHPAEDAAAGRALRRAGRADARHDPGRAAEDLRRTRSRRCS